MIKKILIISFLLILVSACKKDEIVDLPVANSPVFTADGNLNGQAFHLAAGDNDAFMNTYVETVQGVDKFSGMLADGSTEIEWGIYNGNIDSPTFPFLEQINSELEWTTNSTKPLAKISKDIFENSEIIHEVQWYNNSVFLGTNTITLSEAGWYNLCAYITFNDGTHQELCNDIMLGYRSNANYRLRFDLNSDGALYAWIDNDKGEIDKVSWSFDNQNLGNSGTELHQILDNQTHKITATVTYKNGAVRTKSVLVDGSLAGNHIPDFSNIELNNYNKITKPRDYSSVIVIKKDNVAYRSDFTENALGTIQITGIDYYGLNNSGQKVYKVNAAISAKLKNMNTNEIVNFDCNTVFGIEIPQ